jgi:hypothetical protein
VERVLYSVAWANIGKRVDARVSETVVEIFADGRLIKTWPCALRGGAPTTTLGTHGLTAR